MRFSSLTMWVALFMFVATSVHAQTPTASPGLSEDDANQLADYFAGRSACLNEYQYGSVTFNVAGSASQTVQAGQSVSIRASVKNTNKFPLPNGRVYVHVLRQDQGTADENWHPLVYEGDVPGTFALAGGEEKSFTFTWPVPTMAPSGIYRAEFFYLAGDRFVMAGLPYAANLAGGSALFAVTQPGSASYVEFDRSSVQLQQSPLALRSVPPVLDGTQPITASATLRAVGRSPQTATVTTSLYRWSITDSADPLLRETQQVTLQPNGSATIPFTWDSPAPGAYELVFEATTDNANQLPTRLKFRFPVAGSVPRIIFAGITGDNGENVTVTSCTVNATYGEGDGEAKLSVANAGGEVLGSNITTASATDLSATSVEISKSSLASGVVVTAQAMDGNGTVTDSHQVIYSPDLLAPYLPQIAPTAAPAPDQFTLSRSMMITIGVVVLLIVIGLGAYAWQRRKGTPPPTIPPQDLNPPKV